jgi:hypothetical protein
LRTWLRFADVLVDAVELVLFDVELVRLLLVVVVIDVGSVGALAVVSDGLLALGLFEELPQPATAIAAAPSRGASPRP